MGNFRYSGVSAGWIYGGIDTVLSNGIKLNIMILIIWVRGRSAIWGGVYTLV